MDDLWFVAPNTDCLFQTMTAKRFLKRSTSKKHQSVTSQCAGRISSVITSEKGTQWQV